MNTVDSKWIFVSLILLALHTSSALAADETGKRIFTEWCTPCHMDSPFAPGTIQLKQVRGTDRAVVEKRDDLTEPLIRTLVRSGFAGMPKFRRTEINETDLDALIEYLVKP